MTLENSIAIRRHGLIAAAVFAIWVSSAFAQSPAGSAPRNNTPDGRNIPIAWDVETGANIKWSAHLGSVTLGTPEISGGKVFIGTNNGAGYLQRYPPKVDLGVLVCFDESTGEFLWQHSNEKLPSGRIHDWPLQGVVSTPLVDGNRLWYVSNRAEVVCLDTEGFRDGENDGPFLKERPDGPATWDEQHEADVVWKFDMIAELGVQPHNWSTSSVASDGRRLFVVTGNGIDVAHQTIPAPEAPSFLCLDRTSGKVLWTDTSPGANILHGQWASPVYGVFKGQPQVLFPGGYGWLYSFDPAGKDGASKLLWKADLNPKGSVRRGKRILRNAPLSLPTIYAGLIYISVGDDPDHGEGDGDLWCLNPVNLGGDVSATLVFNRREPETPVGPQRRGMSPEEGDFERQNPRSAIIWHYTGRQPVSDDFTETMHRSTSTIAIKHDLVIAPDSSGLVHCLDAKSGKCHWVFDVYAAIWSSPLIVDHKVYVADEDGDVHVFALSRTLQPLGMHPDDSPPRVAVSCYATPAVNQDVLFIADKSTLFAIAEGSKSQPLDPRAFRYEED